MSNVLNVIEKEALLYDDFISLLATVIIEITEDNIDLSDNLIA